MTTKLLMKADPTEDAEGFLTARGVAVATEYARTWVLEGARYLKLEREHPELVGLFYDIRSDADLAHRYADNSDDPAVQKSMLEAELTKALGTTKQAMGPGFFVVL